MLRSFPAEYISNNGVDYFFNVDLGFKKWYVAHIVMIGPVKDMKFGEKVWLRIRKADGKPPKYIGWM